MFQSAFLIATGRCDAFGQLPTFLQNSGDVVVLPLQYCQQRE